MAKASRTLITVRRFERPPRSASMKHPIMRTLLDLCLLFSRVEQKKQHKLSEKVVDFLAKVVNF